MDTDSQRVTGRGFAPAGIAAALLVALTSLVAPRAEAAYIGPGSMTLVSTPNSVFGGGRNPVNMSADIDIWQDSNEPDPAPWQLYAWGTPYERQWEQTSGLRWNLFAELDTWNAGDLIPISGTTEDFGLATLTGEDQWGRQTWVGSQEVCPELTGSVSVEDLERDANGKPIVIALSFRLDCGAGDTTWGAFAFGADLPPLPDEAIAVAEADQAIPRPSGEDGQLLTASPEDSGDVTFGWRRQYGFLCADLTVTDADTEQSEHSYRGRDDDYTARDIDPTRPHEAELLLWDNRVLSCDDAPTEDAKTDAISLNPVTVSLAGDRSAPFGEPIPVRGRVEFPFSTDDVAAGPAVNTRVELWSSSGEEDTLLGTTRTDARGSFRVDVTPYRGTEVWAVVRPGRAGWQQRLIHFGATSARFDLSVAHVVRASVIDPTVVAASSVEVSARLRPGDDTTPVYLERKTRDGSWTRVDMAVTEVEQPVTLTFDEVRPGWQALRVVAPNDGWHLRGVSNRLRVFGY